MKTLQFPDCKGVWRPAFSDLVLRSLMGLLVTLGSGYAASPQAQTIAPITWNVIGLDSNKPASTQLPPGVYPPDRFPVGIEVCNTTGSEISNHKTVFVWDETPATNYMYLWDSGVNLNDNDNTNDVEASTDLTVPTLAAGECTDIYHWVQIKQVSGAYNYTRDFHIELKNGAGATVAETPRSGSALSTDEPRELYVEQLISQNRNTILGYEADGEFKAADGNGVIIVQPGQSFELALLGQTATQGYEQLEVFMTLPPDLFEVSEVVSTYSASSGTDANAAAQLYADGCGWINNPTNAGYHLSQYTCTGVGKYGGKVRKNYFVQVRNVAVPANGSIDVPVQALIYDFSGSSFHYNSDYSKSTVTIRIVDGGSPPPDIAPPDPLPTFDASVAKTVAYNGGSSSGTFTLTVTREADDCTPFGSCAKNFTLTDLMPAAFRFKPQGQNSCNSGTEVVTAGAGSLQFADDENAALGACDPTKRFLQWNGTLPAGVNTVVATIEFSRNPALANISDESEVTNCAYLGADQDSTNNEDCVQVSATATEPFDVGVQKSVTQVNEDAQGNFIVTFKIEVNTLVTANTEIEVSDALPAGYIYQAVTGETGGLSFDSEAGGVLTFTYAAGSSTGSATFTAQALLPNAADSADTLQSKYLNVVRLLNAAGEPLKDQVLGNNEAAAGWVPPLLQITKTPASTALDGNSATDADGLPIVSYDLTVKKLAGLVAGNTVRLTESPPVGFEFTAISEAGAGSSWTCTLDGNAITNASYPITQQVICERAVAGGEATPVTYPVLTFASRLNPVPTTETQLVNTAFIAGFNGNTFIPTTFEEDNGLVSYTPPAAPAPNPPTIAKSFTPASATYAAGAISSLELTITNPNAGDDLTNVAVTDNLPAGMTVAGAAATTCTGGTVTAALDSGSVALSGATLNRSTSCTVTVDVQVTGSGAYANTTGKVSGEAGGSTLTGGTASATFIANAPGTYSVRGLVFQEGADFNGLRDGSETGTNGGGLYACLNASPVKFAEVGADGQFSFANVEAGDYAVSLATTNTAATCPDPGQLNSGWLSTGESTNATSTDGTADSVLRFTVSGDTSGLELGIVQANIFDPPFGIKTGLVLPNQPIIRWTMVWINDSPIVIENAEIIDEIREGTEYRAGSLECIGRGITTYQACEYEADGDRIRVVATFGPESGNPTDEASAENELIIRFDVSFDSEDPLDQYENQGTLSWDPGTGTPKISETDDPAEPGIDDPTTVVPPPPGGAPLPVPTSPLLLLGALALLMGMLGRRALHI